MVTPVILLLTLLVVVVVVVSRHSSLKMEINSARQGISVGPARKIVAFGWRGVWSASLGVMIWILGGGGEVDVIFIIIIFCPPKGLVR